MIDIRNGVCPPDVRRVSAMLTLITVMILLFFENATEEGEGTKILPIFCQYKKM